MQCCAWLIDFEQSSAIAGFTWGPRYLASYGSVCSCVDGCSQTQDALHDNRAIQTPGERTIRGSPASRVPTGYNRGGSSLRLGASLRHVDFVEEHMPLTDNQSREHIRELNDAFRKTLDPMLGRVMLTARVDALPSDVRAIAIRKVARFDDFSADNDPHGEHDFGSFDLASDKFFWKTDYYDSNLEFGSDDPADPSKTTRVLTLMLAAEY